MSAYQVKLIGRDEIARGTTAFRFEKPAGFSYKPGQAVDIAVIDAPAKNGENLQHAFSLVSAPFEEHLIVATRMRDSAFKRALATAEIGTRFTLDGPFGSLTLHNKRSRPAVFIAGGIGITPFMSMLRQAAHDELAHPLLLLYSNRQPEDASFLTELQRLEQRNRNFRLVATMTQPEKSSQAWGGESGPINAALLKKTAGALTEPIYYLVGPPAMVEAMRQTLNAAGVDGDDVRSEEFYGY
jgi:ferredoxin-NADP reductase